MGILEADAYRMQPNLWKRKWAKTTIKLGGVFSKYLKIDILSPQKKIGVDFVFKNE